MLGQRPGFDYRVMTRLEPQAEYNPPDDIPKLVADVVDVESTGTSPDHNKIIEFGVCLFEYDRQNGRIYKVLDFFGNGSKIPACRSRLKSSRSPVLPMRRSPVIVSTIAPSDVLERVVLVSDHKNDCPPLPRNIGHAAVSISTGTPRASGHRRLNSSPTPWGFSTTAIGPERLSGYPTCIGAIAPRPRAAGIAGSFGTSEIVDMTVMGKGRRHREEEYAQGPSLRVEPRRVRATEMLVSRCVGCGQSGRDVVAPSRCDGAESSSMAVADHGERSVLGS
jgi:hypothetical protein